MRGLKILGSLVRILRFLCVPRKLICGNLEDSLRYFFNPFECMQGVLVYLTGNYGIGGELIAQRLFKILSMRSRVVIDIGAHYGFYTLIAAKYCKGVVYAFEPSMDNFKILKRNVEENSLNNVKLYRIALGDQCLEALLAIPKHGMSGENTLTNPKKALKSEKVLVKRFDDIALSEGLKSVDLVKIDVEGFELRVLKGFGDYLSKANSIICEIHPRMMLRIGDNVSDIYKLLMNHGFRIYQLSYDKPHLKRIPNSINVRHHILALRDDFADINELNEILKECRITITLRRDYMSKILQSLILYVFGMREN